VTVSLYSATVPGYLQVLDSVAGLLVKAKAHCAAKGLPDEALTEARLADDMWPFKNQIRSCRQHSIGAIEAVLTGEFRPDFSEPPTSFDALSDGIADAIAKLKAVSSKDVDAHAEGDASFVLGDRRMDFTAQDYIFTFAMPNFYFHSATAYGILRNQGLEIGKRDYLGQIRLKH
jgi:hypothetical protein